MSSGNMDVLDEIDNLSLDINRDIQAMVFFMRTPPRVDTNQKFVELAKNATADYKKLSSKKDEAISSFPQAHDPLNKLDLIVDQLQQLLVSAIRQVKDALSEFLESLRMLTPGPSLDFLASLTTESSSMVEKVVSNTRIARRIINGEELVPQIRAKSFQPAQSADHFDSIAASLVIQNPTASAINTFLGISPSESNHQIPSNSPQKTENSNSPNPRKKIKQPTFESMMNEYDKQERREQRRAQRRELARQSSDQMPQKVLKRAAIQLDDMLIDSIVLQLSDLTSIVFKEDYSAQSGDFINLNGFAEGGEDALKTLECASHLSTASAGLERALMDLSQFSLAKMVRLHLKDIVDSLKEIMASAPQISRSSLQQLDISIKDYATTIKDVVQLTSPEYESTYDDDSLNNLNGNEYESEESEESDEDESEQDDELIAAFDDFENALDSIHVGNTSPKSPNSSSNSSKTTPIPTIQQHTPSPPTPSSAPTTPITKSQVPQRSGVVTIQFFKPVTAAEAAVAEAKQATDVSKRPSYGNANSDPSMIDYATADELIRTVDLKKMPDRWQKMHDKAEESKYVEEDEYAQAVNGGSNSGSNHQNDSETEKSKVFAAFKFMTQKVAGVKKKTGSTNVSGPISHRSVSTISVSTSSDSISSNISNSASSNNLASSGGSTSSNSPSPREAHNRPRSLQLTSKEILDPRIYLFESPDDDAVIKMSPDGEHVVSGIREKLVQRLTHDSFVSPEYARAFLITHTCFITSSELLNLLRLRWDSEAPPNVDPLQFENSRLPSIRLRVYNFLRLWIDHDFNDLISDPSNLDKLRVFVAAMYHGGLSSASQTLQNLITKKMTGETAPALNVQCPPVISFVKRSKFGTPMVAETGGDTLPMILSMIPARLPQKLSLLDFHPQEIARQICLMEHELWKQVKSKELLDTAWTRKDKETRSPNVLSMIRFSNHITGWLISEILSPQEHVEKSVMLNRILYTVRHLMELHNFNASMECLSALHSSAVYRIRSLWNMLPPCSWTIFESLEKLLSADANFKSYRSYYEAALPPSIPYLGTHLSDLLFLEEKTPTFMDQNKEVINFSKMEKTASMISQLELSQSQPYAFTPIPLIQNYIKDYIPMTDKEAYAVSVSMEGKRGTRQHLSTSTASATP